MPNKYGYEQVKTHPKYGYEQVALPDTKEEGFEMPTMRPDESFLSKLPRNIVAGLANLGHSTLNVPYEAVKNLENQASEFGQMTNKGLPLPKEYQELLAKMPKPEQINLSEHIPHQQDYDFAQMLGQKGNGTLMDKIIQKGVEYSPEILTGRALIKGFLKKHPITQNMAARQLREADKIISELGAKTPLSNATIESSKPFLPNTHATKEMLAAVQGGEYKPTFSLQSQLGHHERNLRKSPLASERLLAPEVGDLKQNILGEMESMLRSNAHLDPRYDQAANFMRGGINDYKKYVKFRDNVWPILKKLGLPTTALAVTAFGLKKGKDIASNLVD